MEVYYDCALRREGVGVVERGGGDCINGGDTDVGLEYIKNGDGILFVRYYKHVFCRGDREFLIQFGRVKDSFALAKMFFSIH
ncbi:dynamin family protein, partial [Bacillus thuringiensis]|uniref:dynamin family protein n=1 Tax=Bacillus thuringiensis TaxID=1428 RepID=UPI00119F0D5C